MESLIPESKVPYSLESEQCILGYLVLHNDQIEQVKAQLEPEAFYQEAAQVTYRALCRAYGEHGSVDLVTLKEALAESELIRIGGIGYLSTIVERLPKADSVQPYVDIVLQKYRARSAIKIAQEITEAVSNGATNEQVITLAEKFKGPKNDSLSYDIVRCSEDALQSLEETRKTGIDLHLGMDQIDRCLAGVRRKLLYMVGGKTSHGKTTFALNLVHHNLETNKDCRILYNVFENADQLSTRLASIKTGVPLGKFLDVSKLSDTEFLECASALGKIQEYGPRFRVLANGTVNQMRSVADSCKPDIIIVDFLQRYAHRANLAADGRLSHEIGKVVSDLQDLALEKNCAVFCLSQFARRPHEYRTRPPEVEDLKESGDIENYSDAILLLYWPWRDTLDDSKHNKNSYKIRVMKNKMGPCMDFDVKIGLETLKITDWGK